jgi:hypothetical protein
MNKCFLYIGTQVLGCTPHLWLNPATGPFEPRWLDAANLFLSRYMPSHDGWDLLMNVAEQNTQADGTRSFQMFRHLRPAPVLREVSLGRTATELHRWGLKAFPGWRQPELHTTSIMAHQVPPGRPSQVELSPTVKTENYSGRTLVSSLDAAVDLLREQYEGPVFSVTDCNTFHTSGYLWGRFALDSAIKRHGDGAVLIVNFDQHRDYNAAKDLVKSDGWGEPLLKNYQGAFLNIGCQGILNPTSLGFVAAYKGATAGAPSMAAPLRIPGDCKVVQGDLSGLGIIEDASINRHAPHYDTVQPKVDVLRDKIPKLLRYLEQQAGAPFRYLFVTVDRDCMLNNGTQWGNIQPPFLDYRRLLAVMEIVISTARESGALFTGMDITGLPEAHGDLSAPPVKYGNSISGMPPAPSPEEMITGLREELGAYNQLFSAYGPKASASSELLRGLQQQTEQFGTARGPRSKGHFKGKKTVTFSLTGGGRRGSD